MKTHELLESKYSAKQELKVKKLTATIISAMDKADKHPSVIHYVADEYYDDYEDALRSTTSLILNDEDPEWDGVLERGAGSFHKALDILYRLTRRRAVAHKRRRPLQ